MRTDPGMARTVPRTGNTCRVAVQSGNLVRRSFERDRLFPDGRHSARPSALPGCADLVFTNTWSGPAPELGGDTAEVLEELGLAAADVQQGGAA
jgi:crotonobetainyl-CoA:carnitine CoA-transferase CaiB-like acyl-CoA transferase